MTTARRRSQLPILVSGPSRVGKETLVSRLLERHSDVFVTALSHTTRKPRPGELGSRSNTYHFVNVAEFKSLIDQNASVEQTFFAGNHHGTSWQTILDQPGKGKILILEIDTNGVQTIRKISQQFVVRCAFIASPSLQVLEDSRRSRGTETDGTFQTRLAQAELETRGDGTRGVDDILIINDDLDDSHKRFEEWVLRCSSL